MTTVLLNIQEKPKIICWLHVCRQQQGCHANKVHQLDCSHWPTWSSTYPEAWLPWHNALKTAGPNSRLRNGNMIKIQEHMWVQTCRIWYIERSVIPFFYLFHILLFYYVFRLAFGATTNKWQVQEELESPSKSLFWALGSGIQLSPSPYSGQCERICWQYSLQRVIPRWQLLLSSSY